MRLLLRSEEHTSELQSPCNLVCRLLLEKKNNKRTPSSGVDPETTEHPTPRDTRPAGTRGRRSRPVVVAQGCAGLSSCFCFFFFNDTATTEIYTLSLHDALPICVIDLNAGKVFEFALEKLVPIEPRSEEHTSELQSPCNLVCRLLLEKKKKQ